MTIDKFLAMAIKLKLVKDGEQATLHEMIKTEQMTLQQIGN